MNWDSMIEIGRTQGNLSDLEIWDQIMEGVEDLISDEERKEIAKKLNIEVTNDGIIYPDSATVRPN